MALYIVVPLIIAQVVGVLIEVPVMLSVVKIVNNTRGWYETGGAAKHSGKSPATASGVIRGS